MVVLLSLKPYCLTADAATRANTIRSFLKPPQVRSQDIFHAKYVWTSKESGLEERFVLKAPATSVGELAKHSNMVQWCSKAQWLAYLLPYPATQLPRVRFLVYLFFSEENLFDIAEVNQQCLLEESGNWLENVDPTHHYKKHGFNTYTKCKLLVPIKLHDPMSDTYLKYHTGTCTKSLDRFLRVKVLVNL